MSDHWALDPLFLLILIFVNSFVTRMFLSSLEKRIEALEDRAGIDPEDE